MPQSVSKLYTALVFEESVSLAVLDTTAVVNEAIVRHALSPVAAAALGRTLTAAAYMGGWLKSAKSSLSVSIDGGGVGGRISALADGALNVRGYAERPARMLPPRADGKLDVGGFVGHSGTLTVIRDDGAGIPFVGTSPLVSGEIAEDFSAYFLTSEQLPTAVALGVKIAPNGRCAGAGGVFLQPLPGAGEAAVSRAEQAIAAYRDLSTVIEREGAEAILQKYDLKDTSEREVHFRCHCSRERAAAALLTLGRSEAEKLLREEGTISVHCAYCNTDHRFNAQDVARLFGETT